MLGSLLEKEKMVPFIRIEWLLAWEVVFFCVCVCRFWEDLPGKTNPCLSLRRLGTHARIQAASSDHEYAFHSTELFFL